MSNPIPSSQFPVLSDADEAIGRANYEAFCEAGRDWLPAPAPWESLSKHVRACWIAGAKAARK